jgi:hypothetical protein
LGREALKTPLTPEDFQAVGGKPFAEATTADLARYLTVGTLAWGRRRMVEIVHTNLIDVPDKRAALLQAVDRVTSPFPLRTLRAPLRRAAAGFATAAGERIREGWQEEQAARWLARQTIPEIVDDVIDYISENPQLEALVREQLAAQSVGLATTVRDTSREWSTTADDIVESFTRRLMRRQPRPGAKRLSDIAKPDSEDISGH